MKNNLWKILVNSSKGCKIIIGICIGLILLFGYSFGVNGAQHADTLKELLVETDGKVLPENEGKLVLITGTPGIENEGLLQDEEMGITVENAVSYSRIPYERIYVIETTTTTLEHDLNDPNDDEVRVNKYLTDAWEDIDTDWPAQLKYEGKVYQNPEKKDYRSYYVKNKVCLGEYRIEADLLKPMIQTTPQVVSAEQLMASTREWIKQQKETPAFQVETVSNGGGRLSNGDDFGSIRIVCEYETLDEPALMTVIGKQVGASVENYELNGFDEYYLYAGAVTKEEFIDLIMEEDGNDRVACVWVMVISMSIIIICLCVESSKNRK